MTDGTVVVRGTTDPDEVAAALAAVAAGSRRAPQPSEYERWRATRLRALQHCYS